MFSNVSKANPYVTAKLSQPLSLSELLLLLDSCAASIDRFEQKRAEALSKGDTNAAQMSKRFLDEYKQIKTRLLLELQETSILDAAAERQKPVHQPEAPKNRV